MAAVAHLGGAGDSSNTQTYTSGSMSPTVGDLLVIFVEATGTTDTTATLTESIRQVTYTQIGFQSWQGTTSSMYSFIGQQLCISATARTFTFVLPSDAATGATFGVERVTGMTRSGTNAVRQVTADSASHKAASGTPTCTFPANCLTGNPTIMGTSVLLNPPAVTEPASWTERMDTGYATPAAGLEVATRDSGFTTAAVTWGSSVAVTWGAHGVELDATAVTEVPPGILVAARR